jgi:quercetin dioxygenase-like cupin family protein
MVTVVVTRAVTAGNVRRAIMHRFRVVLSVIVVMLLGIIAGRIAPIARAQEATPAAGAFTEGGITFEPLAYAAEVTLPESNEFSISRVSFDPGAGFPIEEEDPAYGLAVVESGELTVRANGPLMVTRAGALAAAISEEMAGGTPTPASEEIAAGQEVTLAAGDTVLFPPNVGGEIRNDGQVRTVVLVAIVGPPPFVGTPAAGTPTP